MGGFGGELLSKVDNDFDEDFERCNLYPALGIGFSLTCSVLIYTKIKILALYIEGKGEYFDNATILGILRGLRYLRGFWTNK